MIFVKILEKNQKLLSFLASEENFTRIFKLLIYYFCYYDETEIDKEILLIILSIFIELTLHREFGEFLNNPINFTLTFKFFPLLTGKFS